MVENATDADLYSRVKEVLKKVVFKTASLEDLSPETRIQEDLQMDSVRVVDLVLELEDEFGISIEDALIEKIKTVRDLVEIIKAKSE